MVWLEWALIGWLAAMTVLMFAGAARLKRRPFTINAYWQSMYHWFLAASFVAWLVGLIVLWGPAYVDSPGKLALIPIVLAGWAVINIVGRKNGSRKFVAPNMTVEQVKRAMREELAATHPDAVEEGELFTSPTFGVAGVGTWRYHGIADASSWGTKDEAAKLLAGVRRRLHAMSVGGRWEGNMLITVGLYILMMGGMIAASILS